MRGLEGGNGGRVYLNVGIGRVVRAGDYSTETEMSTLHVPLNPPDIKEEVGGQSYAPGYTAVPQSAAANAASVPYEDKRSAFQKYVNSFSKNGTIHHG